MLLADLAEKIILIKFLKILFAYGAFGHIW
jgi:hypothetical protein